MTQNPFDEPGDPDRTVIRPAPGGSRAPARPPPRPAPPPPAAAPPAIGPDIETVATGNGPLAIAAAPLLQLLGRLRNTATAPDPAEMREKSRRELRAFEKRARDAGVPMNQMRQAHYALCATLDDIVLNTPWGSRGRWREEPLAVALHKDDNAGAGFFDQLRTLRATLPDGMPVVELMFLCLSLGMMGPYRTAPEGGPKLARVHHQVFGLLEAEAGPAGAPLSTRVSGVRLPPPPRGGLPVWVAASAAFGLVAAVYVACLTTLNGESDAFYTQAQAAPPAAMPTLLRPPYTPPPPPPPAPTVPDTAARLRAALSDLPGVTVLGTPAAAIIRIADTALFPAANATLAPGPIVERLARAIAPEPGPLRVIGYTDNQVPKTVAFPSKFALSHARAAALRAALAKLVPNPARLVAEGRADADPVAPNTTADGRERNRRIEIVVPQGP